MGNNLNEDEMVLQDFLALFWSLSYFQVQAGIPRLKKNSLFYGTTH